jgi:hypothetical protein
MGIAAEYDRQRLDKVLHDQFRVISRSQLLECGMTAKVIQHLIGPNGQWLRLLPGIYAADAQMTTERRDMAARLHAGPAGVITSGYAVRRFGLQASGSTAVEVLVPPEVRRLSSGFIRLIRTARMPVVTYRMGPIRYAGLVRAVADAVRGYTQISDARAVVCAAIGRPGCTFADLAAELADGPVRGSLLLRRALRDAARGIWSAAEGDLMDLIRSSDLEQPEFNVALYAEDGTLLGIVDAWWQRAGVAAEVDSLEHHFKNSEDREATMERHNRIARRMINLLHFTPLRITSDGTGVLTDLRIAIAEGRRRPPLPIRGVPQRARTRESLGGGPGVG